MAKKKEAKVKKEVKPENAEPKKETKKEVKPEPKKSSRTKEIDAIRIGLLKEHGSNAVIRGKDLEKCTFGRISTGSITLDLALGGGIPVGRMIQISGAKSSCKSSICDHISRSAQETIVNWTWVERKEEKGREIVEEHLKTIDGLIVGYVDVEGTKTEEWTRDTIGVDTESWIYSAPEGMEEALDIAIDMQKKGVNLVVIDSIDSLVPLKEYQSAMDETVQMGVKQKLMGEYCRKVTAINNGLRRRGQLPCTVIFINQLREKIGAYGDPEYTPGGRAIEFYISVDLRLKKGDWITVGTGENKAIVGQVVKFKTNKNKTYKQQQTGDFDFYFDDTDLNKMGQIDTFKEIIVEGMAWGVIERAGAWFSYKGENIGQGAEKTIVYLRENPDVFESVKKELFDLITVDVENHLKDAKEDDSSDE